MSCTPGLKLYARKAEASANHTGPESLCQWNPKSSNTWGEELAWLDNFLVNIPWSSLILILVGSRTVLQADAWGTTIFRVMKSLEEGEVGCGSMFWVDKKKWGQLPFIANAIIYRNELLKWGTWELTMGLVVIFFKLHILLDHVLCR